MYLQDFSLVKNIISAKPTKWSNTLKQFVGNSSLILSVFDHFLGLTLLTLNVPIPDKVKKLS